MLATRLLRTSAARRLVHTTAVRAAAAPGKDTRLSQGNDGIASDTNESPGDVQDQAAQGGQTAHASSSSPMDAASAHRTGNQANVAPGDRGSNPEAIGLQDQIGGQGAQGRGGEIGGQQEAQAPGVLASVKQALGFKTSAGDVKQNQHGGRGVTGTGTTRKFHTSARVSVGAGGVRADPDGAREEANTPAGGDQSAHLKHKSANEPDSGKGNAASTPTLPSERAPLTAAANSSTGADRASQQRRGLHTSARAAAGHSADSYFKDVDKHAPRDSSAPHAVDSTSSALDAPGETATGPFSQEGKGDAAYQSVSSSSPCVSSTPPHTCTLSNPAS
jgi:hypothetical protein